MTLLYFLFYSPHVRSRDVPGELTKMFGLFTCIIHVFVLVALGKLTTSDPQNDVHHDQMFVCIMYVCIP